MAVMKEKDPMIMEMVSILEERARDDTGTGSRARYLIARMASCARTSQMDTDLNISIIRFIKDIGNKE